MINSMHLATTNIYEIRENHEQEAAVPGEKLADGSAGVRMRAVVAVMVREDEDQVGHDRAGDADVSTRHKQQHV